MKSINKNMSHPSRKTSHITDMVLVLLGGAGSVLPAIETITGCIEQKVLSCRTVGIMVDLHIVSLLLCDTIKLRIKWYSLWYRN